MLPHTGDHLMESFIVFAGNAAHRADFVNETRHKFRHDVADLIDLEFVKTTLGIVAVALGNTAMTHSLNISRTTLDVLSFHATRRV